LDEFNGFFQKSMLVMGMKSQDLLFELKMIQELVGHSGVFGKNERCFFQNAQGPQRDVF
jgi:hypothetical protein